jgi:DNA-directed RNA polymerase subunit RPC12/RpoP
MTTDERKILRCKRCGQEISSDHHARNSDMICAECSKPVKVVMPAVSGAGAAGALRS